MGVNKLFHSILLFFLLITCTTAQKGNVNISGLVTDSSSGEFLIGSNILLYKDSIDVSNPPLKGTTTNQFGFYAIPNISRGQYFIIIRNLGYKTLIREVNVTISKGTVSFNAKMKREDIKLEEIIVKGKKEDETAISTIDVSPELLSRLPSLSGEVDLFKTLEMLPGVKTASELSNGLYVRGGSPDQTLTLLDGVIVYNPSHLGNFASTFNSNALQNVKLIKGAFPAEYGGRLSSILDVQLRSGTKEKDKRSLGIGMISSNIMLEGPLSERATYMLSGRKMYYDFFQKSIDKNSGNPRYNFYDLNGKFNYNISESSILSISALFGEDKLYSPPKSEDIDYDISWMNSTLSLNWLQINSESLLLNSTVSYIDYEFRSNLSDKNSAANSSNYFSSSRLRDVFLKSNVESNWSENHLLKVGAELALHNYNLIYSDFYNELLEEDPNASTKILSSEASVFFQNEWQIQPELKTNLGARFYYFKTKEYFKIEPRISVSYLPSQYFNFNVSYAVAHQFLHLVLRNDIALPTDLWYPSSEHIKPSKSEQYVFGINSYLFEREYLLSVETYYKNMKNLIEFKNASTIQVGGSIEDQFTVGEGEAYGVEFFLNKRAGDLTGWIGYTLSWTKRKFEDLNAGRIFYPRYDRRHDVSAVLVYNITEDISTGLTWTFASGQGFTLPTGQYQFQGNILNPFNVIQFNYTERNGFRLPSYHKMDLNITYKFNWLDLPFEVFLNIYNLYNNSNPFAYYITYQPAEEGSNDTQGEAKIKQINLFPFIPSVGVNIKF